MNKIYHLKCIEGYHKFQVVPNVEEIIWNNK